MKFVRVQRFKDSDKLSWGFALVGLFALVFALVYGRNAFPAASIEFKYSKGQIEERARQHAKRLGFDLTNTACASIFDSDEDSKTFLEYKLGLDKANHLMRTTAPVWFWGTRFFRSMDNHDLHVFLGPDGSLVGFEERIPNDEQRTTISHDRARQLAIDLLRQETHDDPQKYQLISEKESIKGEHEDHSFTWRQKCNDMAGGNIDYFAGITGNKITTYRRFVSAPPSWNGEYKKLRSYNETLYSTVKGIYFALFVVAAIVFFWALQEGELRWRFALSVAAIMTLVHGLQGFNSLDHYIYRYDGQQPYADYLGYKWLNALSTALMLGIVTLILTGAGERVYRLSYPRKQALESFISLRGLRTSTALTSLAAGHIFCCICLGWVVLYYLIGSHVGIYTPLENTSEETFGSNLPFLSAISVGFMASIHEEFLYRVLCLSFLERIFKNFWVANILQAMAWAFMHSTYPEEPAWARGLELTVFGSMAGLVMRRYGLFACIASHYIYDAFLGVTPLITSQSWLWKLEAFLAVIPFAALALVGYSLRFRRRTRHEIQGSFTNRSIAATREDDSVDERKDSALEYKYQALGSRQRLILLAVLLLALYFRSNNRPVLIGNDLQLLSNRTEVIEDSKKYLKKRHLDVSGSAVSAELEGNFTDNELVYLFDNLSLNKVRSYFVMPGRPLSWQVTFSRPKQNVKYIVEVNSKGIPQAVEISVPDSEHGEKLSRPAAERLLTDFIANEHPELLPYKIDSVQRDEMPNRVDYTFTITIQKFAADRAEFKTRIEVIGDQVSGFWYWWEIPDRWSFKRGVEKQKPLLGVILSTAALTAMSLAAMWWMIGLARAKQIPWKESSIVALMSLAPFLMSTLNSLPTFFSKYDINTPISTYIFRGLADDASNMLSTYLGLFIVAAFALGSLNQLNLRASLAETLRTLFLPGLERLRSSREIWLDGTLCGYFLSAICGAVVSTVYSREPTRSTLVESFDRLCALANGWDVFLNTISSGLQMGVFFAAAGAILCGFFSKTLNPWILIGLVTMSMCCGDQTARDSSDALWVGVLVVVVVVYLCIRAVCTKLARNNVVTYFLMGFGLVAMDDLNTINAHASKEFFMDKCLLVAALGTPLAYVFFLSLRLLFQKKNLPAVVKDFEIPAATIQAGPLNDGHAEKPPDGNSDEHSDSA